MPKHILVISQVFYPESFRINDICCEWVKRGYKVSVLTGIPNYPQGKFYKGYGWFKKRRERWNGIDIIRIPLIARGKGRLGLVANYLSFVVSGFFWRLFTRLKADLVFTFGLSPMTQALIGVGYSKRRKIPNYLYVQDLWPENVESVTGIHSPIVIRPISRMVNRIYKDCDKIFTTSPSLVKEIQKRTIGEESKVIYWPQYGEDFYLPSVKKTNIPEIPDDGKFKIIFTGNIGQAQGLCVLSQTARLLKDQGIDDVSFVIVGDGSGKQALIEEVKKQGVWDMFHIIGRQPSDRIPELLAACDAAFISFSNDPLWLLYIPAKLQSYLACGMPVLASAGGETARVISEADCGVCCGIGDADALSKGIKQLRTLDLSSLSENARSYFALHFTKTSLMDEMDGYIEGIAPTIQP